MWHWWILERPEIMPPCGNPLPYFLKGQHVPMIQIWRGPLLTLSTVLRSAVAIKYAPSAEYLRAAYSTLDWYLVP